MTQFNISISAREATDLVYRAKLFAVRAHDTQKYGEFPYAVHLQAVESVLIRFGIFDDDIRAAAWLHDVLEDTDVSYEQMVEYFGREITDIVADVTEPKGGNRKWRHEQTYPRTAKNYKALLLKLADRIANVEAGGKVDMYRSENDTFHSMLTTNFDMFDADEELMVNTMFDYLNELLSV